MAAFNVNSPNINDLIEEAVQKALNEYLEQEATRTMKQRVNDNKLRVAAAKRKVSLAEAERKAEYWEEKAVEAQKAKALRENWKPEQHHGRFKDWTPEKRKAIYWRRRANKECTNCGTKLRFETGIHCTACKNRYKEITRYSRSLRRAIRRKPI